MALLHVVASAQVVYRELVAMGNGSDPAKATVDALENAIAQVGGMKLSTSASLTMSEATSGGKTHFDESFRQDIERLTRGVVKSYSVLESGTSPASGRSFVKIRAIVPIYKPSDQLKRLRLAVLPLRVVGPAAARAGAADFAEAVSASVEAFLTQTRRFAMVDRRYTDASHRELQRVESRNAPIEETVKVGMRVGADYMVLAALKEFSPQESPQQRLSGRVVNRTQVSTSVDVRVIDIATGQIKFAQTYVDSRRLPAGHTLAQYGAAIGEDIGELIGTAIYPIAVVAAAGDAVTLNQGGDTVRVGQQYRIVRLGQKIVDPYTRESLGQEEIDVGRIEVTSVTDRTSAARVVHGQLPPSFTPGSLLARALADEPPTVLSEPGFASAQSGQGAQASGRKPEENRDAW